MAKFLKTNGVSHHLDLMVDNAKEKLYLVSPFLKFNDRIRKSLEDADRRRLDFRIVYGKEELLPKEKDWLKSLKSLKLEFCRNLHAKCYLNENEAIVTSMNLYDFSQVNNIEMGILISRKDDCELYWELHQEVMRLMRPQAEIPQTVNKAVREPAAKPDPGPERKYGYCIRTGVKIPFDLERPMSYDAFQSWNRYANADYPEKYCHFSGEHSNGETSFDYPVMRKNWSKANAAFILA